MSTWFQKALIFLNTLSHIDLSRTTQRHDRGATEPSICPSSCSIDHLSSIQWDHKTPRRRRVLPQHQSIRDSPITGPSCTISCFEAIPEGMVWHGVVWYGMVWYGMVSRIDFYLISRICYCWTSNDSHKRSCSQCSYPHLWQMKQSIIDRSLAIIASPSSTHSQLKGALYTIKDKSCVKKYATNWHLLLSLIQSLITLDQNDRPSVQKLVEGLVLYGMVWHGMVLYGMVFCRFPFYSSHIKI